MKKKLIDVTPAKYKCPWADCPAIFRSSADTYVIVGKICNTATSPLLGRVGPDEMAIEIPAELLESQSYST